MRPFLFCLVACSQDDLPEVEPLREVDTADTDPPLDTDPIPLDTADTAADTGRDTAADTAADTGESGSPPEVPMMCAITTPEDGYRAKAGTDGVSDPEPFAGTVTGGTGPTWATWTLAGDTTTLVDAPPVANVSETTIDAIPLGYYDVTLSAGSEGVSTCAASIGIWIGNPADVAFCAREEDDRFCLAPLDTATALFVTLGELVEIRIRIMDDDATITGTATYAWADSLDGAVCPGGVTSILGDVNGDGLPEAYYTECAWAPSAGTHLLTVTTIDELGMEHSGEITIDAR